MEKSQEIKIEFDKDKNSPIRIEPGKTYRIIITQDKIRYKPLSGAHFDLGKSFLRPSCIEEMGIIKELLLEDEESKVIIFGHTDVSGKAKKNRELALRRAKAMKAAIENKPEVWMELYKDEGWKVQEAQYALKALGYEIEITGHRDKKTSDSIGKFREEHGFGKAEYLMKSGWEKLIEEYLNVLSPNLDLKSRMVDAGETGICICGEANPVIATNGAEALNRRTIVAITKKDLDFPCDNSDCPSYNDQSDAVEIMSCKFYRENIIESTGEHQIKAYWKEENAREGDEVTLIAEGEMPGGAEVEFTIIEDDVNNEDELVVEGLKAFAKSGRAEVKWVYKYFEDEEDEPTFDDISGHGPAFLEPGAYNPPEYYFVAKVGNSEVRSAPIPYNPDINIKVEGDDFSDEDFILYHSKGVETGSLQSGRLIAEDIPPGEYHYVIKKKEEL